MEASLSSAGAVPAQSSEPLVGERPVVVASHFDSLGVAFAVLFGVVMSLCVDGYQFGRSNHTVYLLDALRHTQPELLANDWFTTRTLQYHAVFGFITSGFYRLGIVEPAFIVGYLVLATMFHLAWYLLVVRVGGGQRTYLLSLLLFYLSAGGFGLGMYQFLQDGAFLPSNVANVALLWSLVLWMHGAFGWSGAAVGVAGLFHLNHAVVGTTLWGAMVLWEVWRPTNRDEPPPIKSWVIGAVLAVVPCAINVALALRVTMTHSGVMPLADFVDLYVRLRHPHHYDPSSWPVALWICFLWPLPIAVVAARLRAPASGQARSGQVAYPTPHQTRFARESATRFFLLCCALLLVALLGAGAFYVSERLVQMSLYRFSIFPKLLSCTGVAYLVCDSGRVPRATSRVIAIVIPLLLVVALSLVHVFGGRAAYDALWRQPGPIGLFVALCCGLALYELSRHRAGGRSFLHPVAIAALLAVLGVGWGRWMGFDFGYTFPERPEYLRLCEWVRNPANTPIDATFLVSPDDQIFRLYARRAIVVNFKAVPQLSNELTEWRKRLCDVLDVPTLAHLPRPFTVTMLALRKRYEALPGSHLDRVAQRYGARYVVTRHRLGADWERRIVFGSGEYVLYDRERK